MATLIDAAWFVDFIGNSLLDLLVFGQIEKAGLIDPPFPCGYKLANRGGIPRNLGKDSTAHAASPTTSFRARLWPALAR